MAPTHSGFSSAYNLINADPGTGYRITGGASGDYSTAYNKEDDFLSQFTTTCKSLVKISFEKDNGWLDVDGTASSINQLLAGASSSYLTSSPAYSSATGRTTLVTGTATGTHNPNGNAAATIQYLDTPISGPSLRANFSLYGIGNYISGTDEAGLARKHPQANIDRGTNTTTAGASPDQFLEIVPSESAEGGLRVEFSGTDASGNAWSNPVYAFGFYLMGREDKRDVYLDVYDTAGTLIHSSVTQEGTSTPHTAAIEYITFQVEANEYPIGSFVLREEFNSGDTADKRDIFSIDDLSLYTGLIHSGSTSGYDEVTRSTAATSITAADYPNAESARNSFISGLGSKRKETITFEPYNGWMDVDNPPSSLTSQNYQFLAGSSSAYSGVSTPNATSGDSVTLKTGSNSGTHATSTSTGANGEVIHMANSGNKVSFTFTNVANYAGGDEPDLGRLHGDSNIDRGINTTNGTAPDTGSNYDQYLEVLPNERAEGQLKVSFEGTDNSGNNWSNPVYDLGFYLMGREIKRDVCLRVYDVNGNLIHNEVTREPSATTEAVVQYFSFSVGNGAPIAYFTLTEDFSSGDTADKRDIFSIDDLTFSTQRNALATSADSPSITPVVSPQAPLPLPPFTPTTTPVATEAGGLDLSNTDVANTDFTSFTPENIANTDWNTFGFSNITPGSTAAQTLDWGAVPFENLNQEAAESINPQSVDTTKLDITNVREIRSNPFLSGSENTPFAVSQGTSTQGSDNQVDIIINGGGDKTIKARGDIGPDLFVANKANGAKMKIQDFELGVDTVLFNIPNRKVKKLELVSTENKTKVFYKDNVLITTPFEVNDIAQLTGSNAV